MITDILVTSRKAYALREDPRMHEPHLLIQILGLDEGDFPMPATASTQVLRMRFDDVFEESPGIDWIEICRSLGNGRLADSGLRIERTVGMVTETVQFFGIDVARALAQWVCDRHAEEQPQRLVIHCLGGVSRSAAVATVLHKRLGLPWVSLREPDPSLRLQPNTRVMRLVRQAMDEALKSTAARESAHV